VFGLQTAGKKILDLGGMPWSSFCKDLAHCEVTYLNLYPVEFAAPKLPHVNHHYVCANACQIPFSDRYFDIVFSNSLIEHVGDFAAQTQVAREIYRVGQSYWIQTPYKHFPIEPHYNFPFYQYLPQLLRKVVHDTWGFSWSKKYGLPYEEIFLLDRQQMQQLFSDAHFYEEKLFFLTKSLTAFHV
jgi:ubiquinone/menaquinone biosynthesis C-methylase UbiE